MTYKSSVARRNAAVDAMATRLDGGRIEVRSGTPPTNITDASTGTKLAELTYGDPAFGSSSSGQATANSIASDTNAPGSGDAGYFREYASGAADTAADGEGIAGEAADSPDLEFDNKTIVAGGTVAISSLTLSMPES